MAGKAQRDLLLRFRLDSQRMADSGDSRALMAVILFKAPTAGCQMLELLLVEPQVQDAAKHNLPTSMRLSGVLSSAPMRCAYRPDVALRDGLKQPYWKFDSQKPFDQQPGIKWHADFTARGNESEVAVKALLLPNVLDVDIIMALSQIKKADLKLFSQLSVQGIVYCLWEDAFEHVWMLKLCLFITDLSATLYWGLGTGSESAAVTCWIVMCAGALRELLGMAILLARWCVRRLSHQPHLRHMWSMRSSLLASWLAPRITIASLQLSLSTTAEQEDLLLLAVTALLTCWLIIYQCRLHEGGVPIHAISISLFGGGARQSILLTLMIFASFCFAFLVVHSSKVSGWVVTSAYRGLLFGSGLGLENLGLEDDADRIMASVTVFSSAFFNVIVLSLLVGVYSTEYSKSSHEIPHRFLQSRNTHSLMYFLSALPRCTHSARCRHLVLVAAFGVCLAACSIHLHFTVSHWALALLLALGEALLIAAFVRGDLLMAEPEEDHFLWICHRSDVSLRSLPAECLSFHCLG